MTVLVGNRGCTVLSVAELSARQPSKDPSHWDNCATLRVAIGVGAPDKPRYVNQAGVLASSTRPSRYPRRASPVQAAQWPRRVVQRQAQLCAGRLLCPMGSTVTSDEFGLPQQRIRGACRICGEVGDLTFEHIPPKAAGNNQTVRSVPLDRWAAHGRPGEFPRHGWRQHQRGTGGYVLCGRCNSLTGRRYVPHFVELANWTLASLSGKGIWSLPEAAVESADVAISVDPVRPGALGRQVLAMLLAVSGTAETAAKRPITRRILLEDYPAAPTDLRVFMTLYRGPGIRVLPVSAMVNLRLRQPQVITEVAFPPFAFIGLLAGPADPKFGVEITEWTELPSSSSAGLRLRLPVSSGHTPFPADYRSLARVKQESGH